MTVILEFRKTRSPAARKPDDRQTAPGAAARAEIVIFPGVRIERGLPPKRARAPRRGPARDPAGKPPRGAGGSRA